MKSFTEKQQQWFDGSMLGDGSLNLSPKSKTDKEYLLLEHSLFEKFCSNNSIKEYSRFDNRSNIYHDSIYFRTLTNEIFTKEYNRWYPNRIKCVPKDLKLSKQLLCSWFLDDGHIELYGAKKNLVKLTFATDDFIKEDVEFLCSLLCGRYPGNYFGLSKNGISKTNRTKFVIKGSNSATIELIKDIQDIIPSFIERKITWKDLNLNSVRLSRVLNPMIDEKIAYSIIDNKKYFTTKDLLPSIIGQAEFQSRR